MVTQIHVLAIDGVRHRYIHNPVNVVHKITEFCEDKNDYEIVHIDTLDKLDNIVRNPPEKLVLVNGHGETMPMPQSWENVNEYLHQISNNIFQHGWMVVSICGMPFWCYSSGENETDVAWDGVNTLLEHTGASANQPMMLGWCNLTPFGTKLSRKYDVPLTNLLSCARLLWFTNLSLIIKSLYRIGDFSGVSAIKIGEGYLVHNAVLPLNINPLANEASDVTDEYVTLLSIILTVGVLDSAVDAEQIFESCKNNEDSLRKKVIVPLLRLKGFRNVSEIHGSDEHGRDIVCFLNDGFGNRINYAFQIKAREIHNNLHRSEKTLTGTIMNQIREAFDVPFNDPFANESKYVHVMYVITSKSISPPAKTTIVTGTQSFKRHVHFIDGGQLKEEWIKSYDF